jgi:hypothetical protein
MKNKIWKIKNEKPQPVKISIALSSTQAPGVILQPGQFCLSVDQMTAPLDKQSKTGFVSIDKDYDNTQNLELGKAYDSTILDNIQDKTKAYAK